MPKRLLFIAKNWPEPNSTAAGRRTLDLLQIFQTNGYDCTVACAAEPTPFQQDLTQLGFRTEAIRMNCRSFDAWVSSLDPTLVIYDRFMTEEQFGWRVQQQCPNAMTILDTSDMHCLRTAREAEVKKGTAFNLHNPIALREIPAMFRCDLTLMISSVEQSLLQQHFQIPRQLLHTLPFLVGDEAWTPGPSFSERKHCMMIGGFKHEPNRDATRWLAETLWPAMKKQLPPDCEMHVYGAYADHAMNQLNNPKKRFFVKGRVEDAMATIKQYRLNLAPLRFGAGQKGKILEGWLTGTPTVSNNVGFESMADTNQLPFELPENETDWANLCATLYSEESEWKNAQQNGISILKSNFLRQPHATELMSNVDAILADLPAHRATNFWRDVLNQQQFRAQEFMGRWIELKEKQKENP